MPIAHITFSKGALSPEQQAELSERMTRALLLIEGGTDTPTSRALAWLLFNEVEPSSWSIGGKFDDTYTRPGGKFLVQITVPEGALDAERKAMAVAAVNDVILDVQRIAKKDAGGSVFVLINEIPEGNWAARGQIAGVLHVFKLVGIPEGSARHAYATDYIKAKERSRREAAFPG